MTISIGLRRNRRSSRSTMAQVRLHVLSYAPRIMNGLSRADASWSASRSARPV